MTALERKAASAGKKLAEALLAIELYDGDPTDVLDEARLALRLEVWHEGKCGRCGRKLTVPDSIAAGLGPECAGRINLKEAA